MPNAKELFEVIADEKGLLPDIIEKDYWLMHHVHMDNPAPVANIVNSYLT